MNLNDPCYDSVLAIDSQLQKLQSEVADMDREFANYKPFHSGMKAAADTPSPEIIEERKTNRTVNFKEGQDLAPSSRDILD